MNDWTVYLLECFDGTYYCGITTDLEKRVAVHNKGKGAKYTKHRTPVRVMASYSGLNHSSALKLECRIKKMPRAAKVKFFDDVQGQLAQMD